MSDGEIITIPNYEERNHIRLETIKGQKGRSGSVLVYTYRGVGGGGRGGGGAAPVSVRRRWRLRCPGGRRV